MVRALGPLFDIAAVGLLAIVFLFPKPGARIRPALARASSQTLDRVAELQARLMSHPGDADAGLELADIYLDNWRPDWALATLGPLSRQLPGDFRLHFRMAIAFAERFDFPRAKEELERAQAACSKKAAGPVSCSEADAVRLSVVDRAVGDVVAEKVDPVRDPNRAKEIIDRALHNVKVPGRK